MNTKAGLTISILFLALLGISQNVGGVYKISDLLNRMDTTQKPMILNFWATWCKPCVQELPAFDSLHAMNNKVEILLVSLDFKEEIDKKINPFLKKNKIVNECVLLDEINGNDYINNISDKWSGAIPATLFVYKGKKVLVEKKMHLKELLEQLDNIRKD
jgi:thiol-disulfide isomerase/thioredoxin